MSGKVLPLSGGNLGPTGLFLAPGPGETAGLLVRRDWVFGTTAAPGGAGNPSIRAGGSWNKTTKIKRKASGTMGDVDTVARVGGSWTGV